MTTALEISPAALAARLGRPGAPFLLDLRTEADTAADPRRIPTAIPARAEDAAHWAGRFAGLPLVLICQRGAKLSQGAAAWARHAGARAGVLAGGFAAWRDAGLPLVPEARMPPRDAAGRTVWVTRRRPKVDRIACPWLIRRFLDRDAVFLFVPPADVAAVAERFAATPFDIEGVFWSHRGEACTFDVLLDEFALHTDPLDRLARLVRGADTARFDLCPEAAGLAALSFGLSALHGDDLAQLEAGLALYDALYAWACDAHAETHNWPAAGRA